jgi:uncharacterized protein YneF (UPF0154 family)
MLTLLKFNLPILAVALVIGIITGAWIFRRRRSPEQRDPNPS